jgi:hypothetical protein
VRALSRFHRDNPIVLDYAGRTTWSLQPGRLETGLFGGNSNWRGPIWMPVNFLIVESLQKFHHYYGDDFKVECPTGSGASSLCSRSRTSSVALTRLFCATRAARPCFGDTTELQHDPHFRDYVPFHEYFHGDTGQGLGASHQTGWTGLIAKLLQPRNAISAWQRARRRCQRDGRPRSRRRRCRLVCSAWRSSGTRTKRRFWRAVRS